MSALPRHPAVSAAALAAALIAGPAFAEVTAQQVWDDWKAQMMVTGESGLTVGSETYENGVLTVTDLGFDVTDEDGSSMTGNLAELVLTENGDGTVSVTMSEEYPITIVTPPDAEAESEGSEVTVVLRHTGLSITASGEPGAMVYDLAAARYAVELDGVTEGGEAVPAEMLLAVNDIAGQYTSTTGAMRDVAYDLGAASMDFLLDATNAEDGSAVSLSGKVQDIAMQATVTLPLDPAADPEMLVMNGFAMDGGYTTGGGQYIFEFSDANGPVSGTASSAGSTLDFAFSKDAFAYGGQATELAVDVTAAAMPFPIRASVGQYGFNIEMPLSKTGAPAPWTLAMSLRDVALNEEVWALFDPQAMLARDPATVVVDLSGTATPLFDVLDPAQTEAMEAAPMPAEVNSVDINEVNVTFGGASVTGAGSFTLDNADMTTFPGMPKPTGAVDLQLNGVNGLIDALVAMGLLPEEQLMGVRMMLGAFATPVGDDQLTSRIEVTADGQVLANGQRIQ